ncbi:hypothetical protein AOQ84DRAFT_401791 [Glonium stellatum]|uniref:Uncharacterized protein n=1 Tax=Glonium stellatum TaxID=574774 RepID=A0A8E2EMZ5_9PEZI|nr:hypothetical protein AOQ84DRAFT_401791 [Glonium stellatum]
MTRSVSISSQRGSTGYDSDRSSDTAGEEEFVMQNATVPPLWQRQDRLSQKLGNTIVHVAEIRPRPAHGNHAHDRDDVSETHSRSSTLGDEQDFDYPEKTPTSLQPRKSLEEEMEESEAESEQQEPPRKIGPLEQQLSALMSKLVFMERENPTVAVTPEEYQALQDKVKALEAEKATWAERHEALFALRDEDVANNIKIRGLLAEERREHASMRKLRDDDIGNVIALRGKLADATRRLERLERSGFSTPITGRPKSIALERRDTTDLFQAAKNAALEQRALELEKANQDLMSQLASLKQDDVSRVAAHKAWRGTVSDLEARLKQKEEEISRSRPSGMSSGVSVDWNRIETMHEEHARFREKTAQRTQQLRSEKETLQKELHRKEDENAELEAKLEKLQLRLASLAA